MESDNLLPLIYELCDLGGVTQPFCVLFLIFKVREINYFPKFLPGLNVKDVCKALITITNTSGLFSRRELLSCLCPWTIFYLFSSDTLGWRISYIVASTHPRWKHNLCPISCIGSVSNIHIKRQTKLKSHKVFTNEDF